MKYLKKVSFKRVSVHKREAGSRGRDATRDPLYVYDAQDGVL